MKKTNDKAKKTKTAKKTAGYRSKSPLPIVVLVLGIVLGGLMISIGIRNNLNSDYDALNIRTEEEVKADVDAKIKEFEDLKEKREEEFNASAFSDEYKRLNREVSIKEGEVLDLEAELSDVKNGFYDNLKQDKIMSSVPLIALGAVVIVFALGLFIRLNASSKKNVILTVSEEK